MGLVSLLLGQPQRGTRITRELTKAGISASIFLDATVRESFAAPVELTQHPVEGSADIADHVIIRPQKLTIEGIISETPFSPEAQAAGIATTVASQVGQAVGGALGGVTASAVAAKTLAGVLKPKSVRGQVLTDPEGNVRTDLDLPNDNTRLRDAVVEFMNIRDSKRPVTIITGLRQYTNFILTGFECSRDQLTGQSIRVNLEFQELIVAESRTEKVYIPKIKNALGKSDQGRKNGTPLEGEKERRASIAFQLARGVGVVD